MHGLRLLHRTLSRSCVGIHGRRLQALVAAVESTLRVERLTLTDVGRGLSGLASEKHKVKRVDRLLGNRKLHEERLEVYRSLTQRLVAEGCWVPVVVDWTAGHGEAYLMLEAAVPVGGRAVAVYQEVHAQSKYKNPQVQRGFVERLAEVLPAGCWPVVIGDAGFQRSFFEAVEAQGWHWVRRLGEPLSVRALGDEQWQRMGELQGLARGRPRELGTYQVSRKGPHEARLCVVQAPKRYRHDRPGDREHGHGTMARRYRKLYRGPWILASNLPCAYFTANDIVELYGRRMQIEETFRDLKSHRFGYALDYTRTRSAARLEVLRLIGALAMFVQCVVGLTAQAKGLTRHFQANTERRRKVLSWAFLARRVIRSERFTLTPPELRETLQALPELIQYEVCPT